MKTDAEGHFELRTILPGSCPGMRVPAHFHFSLWGAGYPLQWVDELRFEGDRYLTAAMLAKAADEGEFRGIQRLTRGEDGSLRCGYKVGIQSKSDGKPGKLSIMGADPAGITGELTYPATENDSQLYLTFSHSPFRADRSTASVT